MNLNVNIWMWRNVQNQKFYEDCITGGKNISRHQLDMLIRLGVKIVFCFDKDVVLDDILRISDRLPDGIPAYYMFDKDNQLTGEKESPSDNKDRWEYLLENNVYPLTDRM